MYWVYALRSRKDNNLYIGLSSNIDERLKYHNAGYAKSTKGRKPFDLIYKEKQPTLSKAREREKYLKSGAGREFLQTIPGTCLPAGRAQSVAKYSKK